MITEIGITAGEIWRLLDEMGPLEVSDMAKLIPGGEDLALMALGWLCREGHIVINQRNDKPYVELTRR